MGRGLSPLQHSILSALEAYPRRRGAKGGLARLATPTELILDVGRDPNPTNRVVMSKALARLIARGLVEGWQSEVQTPGAGLRYCLPGRYQPKGSNG